MDPQSSLDALAAAGRLRALSPLPVNRACFERDGQRWLNFSSNDYLAMAHAPQVKAAAQAAIQALGVGAAGSRLTSGHLDAHAELEGRLAQLLGQEGALLFGSGYLANLGALTALCGPDSQLFFDRLNHASLIDGAQASGARLQRYRHLQLDHLERLLQRAPPSANRWIVTESVFSMDGDRAPLPALRALADRYRARLFVDESHAVAAIGPGGRGLSAATGVQPDLISCGLGKGFGGYGGFLAGERAVLQLVINRARSFIYSTGLPPANVAAAGAVLNLLAEQGDALVGTLADRTAQLAADLQAAGLPLPDPTAPILPLQVGENRRALQLAAALKARRIICVAIRPPTVPEGTARLRLSVSLGHSPEALRWAAAQLREAYAQLDA